jgi:hypothetical protein
MGFGTVYGAVRLFLKFRFCVEFFLFSGLGIVSLPCEWSWAIRLSAACCSPALGAHYGAHANVLAESF